MPIVCSLDMEMSARKLTTKGLAAQIGITEATIRKLRKSQFSMIHEKNLALICKALDLQPGDLLHYVPEDT